MIIISKDKTSLANMDHVLSIYVASDYCIKANMNGNPSMIKLGIYRCEKEAESAFRILTNSISSGKSVIFMPQDEEIKTMLGSEEKKMQRIGGKKQRGHGGS